MRFAILLFIGLGIALFVVNLGGYPFYTKGEPREAITVLAMVEGGGIILPLRAGIEVPSKPPLMHWLAAVASEAAGGVSEATVRLPSALFAIGGIIACYLYVSLLFDGRIAMLAALMLATTFQYLQAGTGARVDMTLTFFIEVACFEILAIAEGLSARWLLLYGAVALAVLSKGPVGAMLPGMVAVTWIAWERRWSAIRRLHPAYGVALVIAIDGGWYLAAAKVRGAAFVHKQVLAENLFRLIHGGGVHEGHAHPFYYLIFALLAGFMPWTLVAPAAWFSYERSSDAAATARIRYLVVWCVVVFMVYAAAQSKRGVYLLGMYPALVGLFGIALGGPASSVGAAARAIAITARAAGVAIFAIAAAGAIAAAMLVQDPELIASLMARAGWTTPALMPALIRGSADYRVVAIWLLVGGAAAGISMLAMRPRADRMVAAITFSIVCFVLIANLIVVPALARATSLRDFTRAAMRLIDDQPAAYLGGIDYEVAFYSDRTIPVLGRGDRGSPRFLFCWRSIYNSLPERTRRHYAIVMESNPTGLDSTGTMLLLRRDE